MVLSLLSLATMTMTAKGKSRLILFVFQSPIGAHESIETICGGKLQEFPIFDAAPTHVSDGEALVPHQEESQVLREILIQEQFHVLARASSTVRRFADSNTIITCSRPTLGNCSRK